jgi:predicted ATPase
VFYPTQFPELYAHLGVSPPCGILLHGPSGCGKTMLATAIAGELGLPYFKVRRRSVHTVPTTIQPRTMYSLLTGLRTGVGRRHLRRVGGAYPADI